MIPVTLKAVAVFKVEGTLLQHEAIVLHIKDGVVEKVEFSTRGGDSLNIALGCANHDMAILARTNPGITRAKAANPQPTADAATSGSGREQPRPDGNRNDRGHSKGGPGKRT